MSKVDPIKTPGALEAPTEDSGASNKDRGEWGSKTEFILTLIGSAVGLGNIWRFPFLCFNNGGAAFLIPYLLCLLFLGLPLFGFELMLGQFASLGHLKIWRFNPLFKGVGFGMQGFLWILSLYYNVIICWAFYFLFAAMTTVPPWTNCENEWNTITCIEGKDLKFLNSNITEMRRVLSERGMQNESEFSAPTEEFFYREVLKRSDGIDQPDGIIWQLALCLLLVWVIIFLVLLRGVSSLGKSSYFATLFPYAMLLAFLIRGATLEGAYDGVQYYMNPSNNWGRLADKQTWSDAATQIFFSLNIGSGGLISFASYNKFHNNALRDSVIVPIINCLTSIFAGFAIFTVLGFMSNQKGVPIDQVAIGGPGLVFIVYPEGLSQMPAPTVWAVLFFLMMVVLGFSSSFSIVEGVFIAATDEFPRIFGPENPNNKRNNTIFRGVSCIIFYLISLPMVTRGGFWLFDIVQDYHGGFPLIILCVFEIMSVMWVYGYKRFMEDVLLMMGWRYKYRDFGYHIACWIFLSPALLVVAIVLKAIDYKPYTSGSYEYPGWAQALGWLVVSFHLVWIFVVFIYRAAKDKNCKLSSSPTEDWGPALPENRTGRYAPKPGSSTDDLQLKIVPQTTTISEKPINTISPGYTTSSAGVVNKGFDQLQ